jgi:hypothetical protein
MEDCKIDKEYWDKTFKGLETEITANGSLGSSSEDRAYNAGISKAIHFVKKYKEHRGLYQIA